MTENAVRFLAKNELGHFSTARFWPGPSLDWRSPHWHLMGFLCYSSLDKVIFFLNNTWVSYSVLNTSKTLFLLPLRRVYLDLRYISLNKQK